MRVQLNPESWVESRSKGPGSKAGQARNTWTATFAPTPPTPGAPH